MTSFKHVPTLTYAHICERVWEKGPYSAKIDISFRSKSSEKFFLSPVFVFCRISLSDPYSTSMPNFKCQNNLKDPKRAVENQATFYSLLFLKYNKRGMGGVSNKQLKKNQHSFETIACTLQLTSGRKFTATLSRVAKDSDKTGCDTLWKLKRTLRKTLLVAVKKQLHDLIAYAEYAVKYLETLIIPEVEIQFMFSWFLVQLLCWIQPSSIASFSVHRRFYPSGF